jgi:hypothetical protein
MITTKQSTQMHALLSELRMMQQKRDILIPYLVQSSKDLTSDQANEVINSLLIEQQKRADNAPKPIVTDAQKATKRARAAMLATLEGVGIKNTGNLNAYYAKVNAFLKKPQIGAKVLYQMTPDDCKAVIAKVKAMTANQGEAKSDDYGTY